MSLDNLKARLAYSTISQLAYIVLGAAMATTAGVLGAGLHIAMHAMGKITLFLCAGAIYSVTKQIELKHMNGVGRIMPWPQRQTSTRVTHSSMSGCGRRRSSSTRALHCSHVDS